MKRRNGLWALCDFFTFKRGIALIVGVVAITAALCSLLPNVQAQVIGVVFPAGSVYSDSNRITVPIVPPDGDSSSQSDVREWKSYEK